MTPILMPDPQEARASGLVEDYPGYRRWWARRVLKLKLRKAEDPEPGALPLVDPELG